MNEEMNERQGTTDNPVFPKALLAVQGEPIYEDESESVNGSYWHIILIVGLIFAFLVWDGFRMLDNYRITGNIWQSINYASIFFVLFALYILLSQAMINYRFRLTETALVVTYRTPFGHKRHEILYENIYGVHEHKARLANNVKFRYKWRWYSLIDSRPLLALFYKIPRGAKKPKFGRVIFKADPQFLLGMNEYMPGRVAITEEETTYRVLVDESNRLDAKEKAAQTAAAKKVD